MGYLRMMAENEASSAPADFDSDLEFEPVDGDSPSSSTMNSLGQQLVWALSALVALFIIGGMVYLWEMKNRRSRRSSDSSGPKAYAPLASNQLMARHVDALRYL